MPKKLQNKARAIYITLFFLYSAFIIYATLLGRAHADDPLCSVWDSWRIEYIKEEGHWNINPLQNLLMMIPFTFLLYMAFPKAAIKKPVVKGLITGLSFSVFIECEQLIFSLGTFQVSDIVYNTMSGGIGAALYCALKEIKQIRSLQP